jgi:hypothetical protein
MAKKGQTDDVWEAVLAQWYPGGVPARANSPVRREVNGAVEDLRGQGVTGEQIELWVVNCKAAQARSKDPWPVGGCSLHTCVTKFAQFAPTPKQIIEHRFDKWKAGLPPEMRVYVGMLMHQTMARQCWLGAAGKTFDERLKQPARDEWERLNTDNQHHTELRNGKVVSLLDEMRTVLKRYLPGGSE